MLESLQALDRTVFLALNGMHTPYWDSFMYIFTSKLVWIPLYVSILYVLYKNMNIRMVIFTTLMFALLVALADQTCSSIYGPYSSGPGLHETRPSPTSCILSTGNEEENSGSPPAMRPTRSLWLVS